MVVGLEYVLVGFIWVFSTCQAGSPAKTSKHQRLAVPGVISPLFEIYFCNFSFIMIGNFRADKKGSGR